MTDAEKWPREIWVGQMVYQGGKMASYHPSEWSRQACGAGEETHRYVDGDICDTAERYWRERCNEVEKRAETAEATIARLTAELETCVKYRNAYAECDRIATEALRNSEARAEVAADLFAASKALQSDMMEREQAGMDVIGGEQYRIVNAGRTAWNDFCEALRKYEDGARDG